MPVYGPIHSVPVITNLYIHRHQVNEAGTTHWEELWLTKHAFDKLMEN